MTATSNSESPAPSSLQEDLITMFGGTWLIIGLFVDGYAHTEIIDTETEDFFTIWHAIFYSGFTFTASWIAWIAYRRASIKPVRTWLPAGYGLAAIGVILFGLGGIGDAIWHTIFGIETSLDALLSPTHLVLFVGGQLILTAPLRSALAKKGSRLDWKSTLPVMLSLTLVTSLTVFFATFAWNLSQDWTLGIPFEGPDADETLIAYGIAGGIISTTILVLPALVLLRRWTMPFGVILVLWVVPSTLEWVAFGKNVTATVAALVGAAVFEVVLLGFRLKLGRRNLLILASSLAATTLWVVRFVMVWASQDVVVGWTAELWTGQIIFGGLVAFGLTLVAVPTARELASPEPPFT